MRQSSQPRVRSRRELPIVLAVVVLMAAVLSIAGCSASPKSVTPKPAFPAGSSASSQPGGSAASSAPAEAAPPASSSGASEGVTALQIKDLKVGTGAMAKPGDTVTVDYTGWLMDGTKFDSSLDGAAGPFTFLVGQGRVIQGWDEGLVGMQVGGKRQLIISPDMGYGAEGYPPRIPPDATLKFEVDLLKITPAGR